MSVPTPSRLPSPYVSIKKLNNCLKGEMCHLLVKIIRRPLSKPGKCWRYQGRWALLGRGGTLGANVKRWPPRVQPTLCQL